MSAIDSLRSQIKGRMIEPEDPGYDEARTTFVGGVDRRPALIVRVAGAADVARVVDFARKGHLELAIRCGGHSGAGHCVTEGGVVIDLRDMHAITIDDQERTAWAEGGLNALDYSVAAHEHGLATGFGDTGSVGIGGLTLGGGVGYLSRRHGLTIDNLIAADVVTADGTVVRADAESNPDLFWAIRGGGGNFGVATRFQFRLQEVGTVTGGMLMLPATAENIEAFVATAHAAPEELTTIANVIPAPPMPFVPPDQHGKLVIAAFLVHCGPIDDGQRALLPFQTIAQPIANMLRPMPYPEIYPPEDPSYHPIAATRTFYLDGFDGRKAETVVEHLQSSNAKMRVAQIRVLGGAISRVAGDATAYAHRTRPIMVSVAALCDSAEELPSHRAWAEKFWSALRDGQPAAYVNFLSDDGPSRIREAYPDTTWQRLSAIKARYDPTNLFRLNQNIAPASNGATTRRQ